MQFNRKIVMTRTAIPAPVARSRQRYPFAGMLLHGPKKTFFVEGVSTATLNAAAYSWNKHNEKGWRFTVRAETPKGRKVGARIWRIA